MSTIITEPTAAHESTCPSWCTRTGALDHQGAPYFEDPGDLREHGSDEDRQHFDNQYVGLRVVSEETVNADGTASHHPSAGRAGARQG